MKINENDKISPLQYTLLIAVTLIGAGILSMPRSVIEIAGPDGWLATLGGGLLVLLLTYLLHKLALMFPQDTFVSFSQKIVGKWLGLTLSVIFFVYFLLFSAYEARVIGEISNVFLVDRTPIGFVMFIYLWVTIMGARGGIEGIARICQLLFPIIFLFGVPLGFLLIPKLHISHLLPILHTPWQDLSKAVFTTSLSFLGFEIILFLVPSLAKPQKAIKNAIIAVVMIIGIYIYIVMIDTALFGVTEIKRITWPLITGIKMVDFPGGILERFESLLLSLWAFSTFTSSIVFTYFAVYIMALVSGFREFKPILYFVMPVIYGISFIPEHSEHVFTLGDFIGKYGFIFITVVTLILFLIVKIQKIYKSSHKSKST